MTIDLRILGFCVLSFAAPALAQAPSAPTPPRVVYVSVQPRVTENFALAPHLALSGTLMAAGVVLGVISPFMLIGNPYRALACWDSSCGSSGDGGFAGMLGGAIAAFGTGLVWMIIALATHRTERTLDLEPLARASSDGAWLGVRGGF